MTLVLPATALFPFPIVLALGSNLGDRRRNLDYACTLLERAGVRILRRSRLYGSRPWGVTDQPPFLNAALAVRTPLRPLELLHRCQSIEAELGRRRTRHWGPRSLDLDILLYGGVSCQTPELTLPHPLIDRRDFVLAPLAELGVPPSSAFAARSWSALLRALPPEERTLAWSVPWTAVA